MRRRRIPWKYCECGCHSSTATIGGMEFSHFNDLQGGHWFSTQHPAHLTGEKLDSQEAVEAKVREALKERKKELKRQLKELE